MAQLFRDNFLSYLFSMTFVLPGEFLCLFTVREHVKRPLPWIILLAFVDTAVYLALRHISWLGIWPFLVYAYFRFRSSTTIHSVKLLYIMMIVVTYSLFNNAVFYMFEGSSYTWAWDDFDTVLYGLLTSLPPMTLFLRKKIWPELRDLDTTGIPWLPVVPATFMALNVVLCSSHVQNLMPENLSLPYTIITTCFAIGMVSVTYLILNMYKKTQDVARYREQMRLIDMQLSIQGKRFEEITAYQHKMRTLRHDMRHHLRIIDGLLSEKRYPEALAYLREYEQEAIQREGLNLSENFIGDMIGRHSRQRAEDLGVEFDLKCALPARCWVTDLDLCVVLGNIMENALNACAVQTEGRRYLKARASIRGNEAIVTAENSCNLIPATDAEIKAAGLSGGTGYGIPSIKAVAEKYNGTAVFDHAGNIFHVSVLMYRLSHLIDANAQEACAQ